VRLLVLGGTLFLGRHVVEAALARGHDVTLFNRGQTNPGLFPEVEHLHGDRAGDLSALRGREWDAVVDPSGYVPRVVRASTELLADATGHYSFVSSISVYRDLASEGITEDYPLAELPEESEEVERYYGALKALCEDVVREHLRERALLVRAGLIVGRYDWTNRFGWWVRRVARGGDLLVPDVGNIWPIQIVHGRDLAEWILDMAERGAGGTYNATSQPLPMEGAFAAMASVSGVELNPVRVDEEWLLDRGVEPFDELPLWLGASRNPELLGFFAVDVARAHLDGLSHRPIKETVADILEWGHESVEKDYGINPLARGLDAERERELLAAWATLMA
jgi:2'-hydroxyisoflavone reductase